MPTSCIPWPASGVRRISIDSFGFGGANSHIILDDAFHTIEALAVVGNHRTLTSAGLLANVHEKLSDGTNETNKVHETNGINEVSGANGVNEVNAVNGINGTNRINGTSGMNGPNGVNDFDHETSKPSKASKATPGYQLLTWSARDEAALKRMLHLHDGYLKTHMHGEANFLGDLAYTLAARRTLMAWRSFSVVDEEGALETLDLTGAKCERAIRDTGVAFIFTGQGAQYANMGMELLRYPVFRATIAVAHDVFQELGAEWSLLGKDSICCHLFNVGTN